MATKKFSLYLRRVFIKAMGYSDDALGRRVIGIVNTASGFNPCHADMEMTEAAGERGTRHSGLPGQLV